MIVIGIDPGLTGACSIVDHNGLRAVFDLPTMKIPGVGPKAMVQNKIDGRAFCALLLKHCPASEGKPTFVIEAVGTMGGANNAVQTQGSLLRSLGALETVAECLKFPVVYAHTQTWKRFYGLVVAKDVTLTDSQRTTAAKRNAMATARRLFPDCTDIGLAKHHNRSEAILIAHWWRRVNVELEQPAAELVLEAA